MRSTIGPLAARALCAAAVALLLLGAGPAQAHSPTVGYSRGSFADVPDQTVPYRFGGAYPSWLTGPARDSLETKYRSWTNNNSRGPVPVYSSAGRAVVYYTAASISPCSGTNTQWLQCATGGGSMSFAIYVRNFDGAPYSDWRWYDKAGTCVKPTGTVASGCWYVRRAMIHEAGHAIPTFGHDGQTESDTVMRSVSPQVGAPGGSNFVFQRCDQAALQILWDIADHTRPYGDCFDHVAGHGVRGLVTSVTTNGTSFLACIGTTKLVGGRLAVKTEPLYGRLSNNPLAGRVLWFDRKRRADTTWTLRAESTTPTAAESGTDWTRTFVAPSSAGGTYDYRAHFDGGPGLDPSNMASFSVTWSTPC
jgi:hypothetical protein